MADFIVSERECRTVVISQSSSTTVIAPTDTTKIIQSGERGPTGLPGPSGCLHGISRETTVVAGARSTVFDLPTQSLSKSYKWVIDLDFEDERGETRELIARLKSTDILYSHVGSVGDSTSCIITVEYDLAGLVMKVRNNEASDVLVTVTVLKG